ncbi:MAG: hypothetical protein ACK4SX_01115 [Alcanivoracaceae bacterium]
MANCRPTKLLQTISAAIGLSLLTSAAYSSGWLTAKASISLTIAHPLTITSSHTINAADDTPLLCLRNPADRPFSMAISTDMRSFDGDAATTTASYHPSERVDCNDRQALAFAVNHSEAAQIIHVLIVPE